MIPPHPAYAAAARAMAQLEERQIKAKLLARDLGVPEFPVEHMEAVLAGIHPSNLVGLDDDEVWLLTWAHRETAAARPVIACLDCPSRATCAVCDRCEDHCQTGGSGRCAAAHDDWLAGGPGGINGGTRGAAPANPGQLRDGLRQAMAELAAENGLRACSCGGLEDHTRPHQHGAA